MASVIKFVESIASSPVVRLDINNPATGISVATEGIDLSPSEYRRTTVSTMLADGDIIPAASYGNRVLKIPLKVIHGISDSVAALLQSLARELARPNNILMVQLHGATSPVFFRTFATPTYTLNMLGLLLTGHTQVDLEIVAEPFAYGLQETITSPTITEDPAAANGMFWDITGVKGDVETPLNLVLPTGNLYDAEDPISVFAMRRRGAPANTPFVLQCEVGTTMGTDTSVLGSDATMSNSSYARTTFATNSSMVRRVYIDPFPTAASVDNRGQYRVFACIRRSSSSGNINVTLGYTSGTAGILVQNAAVATAFDTARHHIDLGLIQFPTGADPVTYGYSGVQVPVRGRYLELRAERTSGSSNVDFDYLLFVPADDTMALVDWGDAVLTTNEFVVDSVHELVYTQNVSLDQVYGSKPTKVHGGFLSVTPGQTNRLFFIRRTARGATVTKTETTVLEGQYWPRYLFVRPATS